MAYGEWNDMGCGDYEAEWECVQGIGQDAANKAFKKHWQTWITKDDISKMISYGLNTIRVCTTSMPLNYFDWMSPNDKLTRFRSDSG